MNSQLKNLVLFLQTVLLFSAGGSLPAGEDAGWKLLFDDKTLEGWEVRSGFAKYHVENDMIVGTTVKGSPNTFLCTKRQYGDFILEFEVKVDPALNSGIQLRSHTYKTDTTIWVARGDQKIKRVHQAGRVYGYQVEISNEQSGTSGGVYDETRRGWLDNIADDPVACKAFKDNQWNKYRIACIGDSIKTWVNGVACADLVDSVDLIGFIGLQVHSFRGDQPAQVRWRNLRIQERGCHEWQGLFDGKSLKGWHALPGGKWEIKDGIIDGSSPVSEKRHGLLISDQRYGNFTARLQFKALKGNSGFYFRADQSGDSVGVYGFQAEIDANNDVGGLYETGGRGWVVQPHAEDVKKWFKPQQWNQMTVSAHGGRIVVHVNGRKTAELKQDKGRREGHLALQLHGGQDMQTQFKDVEILVPRKGIPGSPFNGKDLDNWAVRQGKGKNKWVVGIAAVSPENPKLLIAKKGDGEMINLAARHGDSLDLYSKDKFGDCHIELELMVAQGSNSGIYVMGEYEIQVLDSYGKTKMGSGDMGAIYGAAPPPVNACRPPGVWQKYVIDFQAPKFDTNGKKIANAQFVKVELNGRVLHEHLEMPGPTPSGVTGRESPTGPIMFQGNHGPVAYRNILITNLAPAR